ncbi:hypothetical protein DYB37_007398 [Aphanomyces astaci]|uniref:Uncharacterized protein n=1 Tax=Aphanomyces astaci TaxID=112090 RepID=A0A418D2L7_APHAT|nr:hypothetical protein DYB35_004638 [Aphanomyces astaci]RHZ15483.1 hypothetical protein DYB37_007398 [Aphanomyces astaci]
MEPCVIPTWRYRIEPQASSGGVLITIPSSRTGVTQILIFMAIWCGAGGFMTSMAMSIAPEAGIGPIVVTLLGATSMTVGVLFRLFASESIAITPTVFTHQWGMLGLNRTKHYSGGGITTHGNSWGSNTGERWFEWGPWGVPEYVETIFRHVMFDEARQLGLPLDIEQTIRSFLVSTRDGSVALEPSATTGPVNGLLKRVDLTYSLPSARHIRQPTVITVDWQWYPVTLWTHTSQNHPNPRWLQM